MMRMNRGVDGGVNENAGRYDNYVLSTAVLKVFISNQVAVSHGS